MTQHVAVRLGAAAGTVVAGFALGIVAAGPAFADLLPSPPAVLAPVTGLLAPSPSPSPSPSPTSLLSPVFQQLPAPVASPLQQTVDTVTGTAPAPASAPVPAAAPQPGSVPAPTAVHPEAQTAPQTVAAPRTGIAAYPRLQPGAAFGASSGLAPLSSGSIPMPQLFPVTNVDQPIAAPQAAPAAPSSPAQLPAGLPLVIVVVAGATVAGAAAAQLAALRTRRSSATA